MFVFAPTTPERPETILAQMDALTSYRRRAVLITPGCDIPGIPQNYTATETIVGKFIHQLPEILIHTAVREGTFGEFLGHLEPKGDNTSRVVCARNAGGLELQTSLVSPENEIAQAQELLKQFPDASIEFGGLELAELVLKQRQL